MRYTPEAAAHTLSYASDVLKKDEPDVLKLERLWYVMTALRGNMLATALQNTVGPTVLSGPFKGMKLIPEVLTKLYGPMLTGIYEHELHDVFERVIAHPYKRILNIGCSFGYYAVGLAMRMPQVAVEAFDIKEEEQQKCRAMAALNGVQDRVHVGGLFKGEDFAAYADGKTLAIVDIEGAEMDLLDPVKYPALGKLDMIVELHDVYNPSISKALPARFAATHDIEMIYNRPGLFDFTPVTGPEFYINPLDGVIITWEGRDGPTPWAVMRAR